MADERAWAQGHLEQARADLEAAKALQGRAPSVVAMLLQMVFEKLGKAALLSTRSLTVERAQASHKAASLLVGILRRRATAAPTRRGVRGSQAFSMELA